MCLQTSSKPPAMELTLAHGYAADEEGRGLGRESEAGPEGVWCNAAPASTTTRGGAPWASVGGGAGRGRKGAARRWPKRAVRLRSRSMLANYRRPAASMEAATQNAGDEGWIIALTRACTLHAQARHASAMVGHRIKRAVLCLDWIKLCVLPVATLNTARLGKHSCCPYVISSPCVSAR